MPSGAEARFTCLSDAAEVFVAGAKYDEVLEPFAVRSDELDVVQYGSDDTKTHRKIKHILGQKQADKVGRLLDLPYPGGPAIQEAATTGDPRGGLVEPRRRPDAP